MQKDSFVNEIWTDMYLAERRSILMNQNALVTMTPNDPTLTQVQQSALMLTCIAKFYCTLRDKQLPPHGFNSSNEFVPYDMSQFKNIFYTTRIPRKTKDEIFISDVKSNHAIILTHGYFYKVQVFDEDNVIPTENIFDQIEAIYKDASMRGQDKYSICSLSLADRDSWVKNRARLIELGNSEILSDIDSALILIVLDNFKNSTQAEALKNGIAGPEMNRQGF